MLWLIFVLVLAVAFFVGYAFFEEKCFDFMAIVCLICGIIGAVAAVIMICIAIDAHVDVDAYIAKMQARHDILTYQLENDVYDNDNDLGKRELYEQIREWNEDIANAKECQNSVWSGMFYANIYDQFELIQMPSN